MSNIPLWKKFGLQFTPPVPCKFSVDDYVKFTNPFGIAFECDVIGFSKTIEWNRFIHIVRHGSNNGEGSAWWFPVPQEALEHIII